MSDTLSLATRLRAMDDGDLAVVLRSRAFAANGIKDFFDLAEALLDRDSVQQSLTRLDRVSLAVVAAIGELTAESGGTTAADVAARLSAPAGVPPATMASTASLSTNAVSRIAASASALMLLDSTTDELSAYYRVRDQLRGWPEAGLPGLAELASAPAPLTPEPALAADRHVVDRLAADRAFAAITGITELLAEIEREPARELAKGGIALPDTKRLAAAIAAEPDSVATFIALLARAGLLARESSVWMIAEAGRSWQLLSSRARWSSLAAGWLARLPADIRQLLRERTHALGGPGLHEYLDWLYPAGGDWIKARVADYTRDAELLGITAKGAPSGPGSLLLATETADAEEAMAALLPPEVEHVYLQHDLSVVAPGPLTPRVDARLRTLADVESRALASSYRVSTQSVNRALAAGETRQSLLDFLAAISLTGIPQPLDYLIAEAASRFGQVRAGALGSFSADRGAAQSYVRSADDQLLGTIMVDQNLTSLGLIRSGPQHLTSQFPLDPIFWALSDAKYPVAAEDESGNILSLRKQRTARPSVSSVVDPIASLLERLRIGGEPADEETGQAWLHRQLDVAIKARIALTVSVRMPNGAIVDYQLEPTSVASGRLRARDDKSAIERTLPLTSIAGLSPAI